MFESLPPDRHRRWDLLKEFVSRWYSPLVPGDGYDEEALTAAECRLGVPLPRALREWYGLAGRRHDVWSRQDELVPPERLAIRRGVLAFYIENQDVVRWGIPLAEGDRDDPPVLVEDEETPGRWLTENASTSEFALQMLVFSSKWSSRNAFWANGGADEEAVRRIERTYPRLAFPDWHWPARPTRLYGKGDTFLETDGGGESPWLWAWSRSKDEFRWLEKILEGTGLRWEESFEEA